MSRKLRVLEIQPGEDEARAVTVDFDLDYLRAFVGGYIEHGYLANGATPADRLGFYIHDEGLLIGLPHNWLATAIYNATHRAPTPYGIAGPMVVVGGPDDTGDDIGVSDKWITLLEDLGLLIRMEP